MMEDPREFLLTWVILSIFTKYAKLEVKTEKLKKKFTNSLKITIVSTFCVNIKAIFCEK